MTRIRPAHGRALCGLLFLAFVCAPLTAGAGRRYFVRSYTPWVDSTGETEMETWLTARTGKADSTHTAWDQRVEFEYAVTPRLTTSATLNFRQAGGEEAGMHFDSPSVELIYALAPRGRWFGDPALYLEFSESGEEFEAETKLLLGRRMGEWVAVANLIGLYDFRHNDEELLPGGVVESTEFTGEVAVGVGRELGEHLALGVESRFRSVYPNYNIHSASIFSLGPSVSLNADKVQLAIGVLPQIWGTPSGTGSRNLVDFEKMEIRGILSIEL